AGPRCTRAAGSSPSALDAPPRELPLDRLAPARQPGLSCLRGRGLSARVAFDRPAIRGAARVHVRPGSWGRRRRGAAALARPRRAYAAPLARARRGGVLRDFLLRLGHALLPRQGTERPRRPDADAARAAALRVLARVGAASGPAAAGRPGRRPRGSQPARPEERERMRRTSIRARRRGRDPAPPPFGRERLAERPGQPGARRGGRRADSRGARRSPKQGAWPLDFEGAGTASLS